MTPLLNGVILGSLAIHLTLLVYAFVRRKWVRTHLSWLALTIMFSAVTVATYLLPESALLAGRAGRGAALILALAALLTVYGALVITDVRRPGERSGLRGWLVLSLVGVIVLGAVILHDGAY